MFSALDKWFPDKAMTATQQIALVNLFMNMDFIGAPVIGEKFPFQNLLRMRSVDNMVTRGKIAVKI
jgi:hypothetical protein